MQNVQRRVEKMRIRWTDKKKGEKGFIEGRKKKRWKEQQDQEDDLEKDRKTKQKGIQKKEDTTGKQRRRNGVKMPRISEHQDPKVAGMGIGQVQVYNY